MKTWYFLSWGLQYLLKNGYFQIKQRSLDNSDYNSDYESVCGGSFPEDSREQSKIPFSPLGTRDQNDVTNQLILSGKAVGDILIFYNLDMFSFL